jgi:hypothetical protein
VKTNLPDPYAEQEFCSEVADIWSLVLAVVSVYTLGGVYCFPQNSWGVLWLWRDWVFGFVSLMPWDLEVCLAETN